MWFNGSEFMRDKSKVEFYDWMVDDFVALLEMIGDLMNWWFVMRICWDMELYWDEGPYLLSFICNKISISIPNQLNSEHKVIIQMQYWIINNHNLYIIQSTRFMEWFKFPPISNEHAIQNSSAKLLIHPICNLVNY